MHGMNAMTDRLGGSAWSGVVCAIAACGLLTLAVGPAAAQGPPPDRRFQYAEVYWRQYQPDLQTSLLLHFSEPAASPWASLHEHAREVKQKQAAERDLIDLDDLDALEESTTSIVSAQESAAPWRDRNEAAPPGMIFDYSRHRQRYEIPTGVSKTPDGRIDDGVAFTGEGSLVVNFRPDGRTAGLVECSFRVERLPEKTMCIFSVADRKEGDKARVLLHPDGHLELKLGKPHGVPQRRSMSEEEFQKILARDPTIRSPEPIEPGRWTHVAISTEEVVVQGAGSPFKAVLTVDGQQVAHYLSEPNNSYRFLSPGVLVLGNNYRGTQPFVGVIDEVRVVDEPRAFAKRVAMPWRDAEASRPLQFDKPYFRADGTALHAGFEQGLDLARGEGEIKLAGPVTSLDTRQLAGPRGQGWLSSEPAGLIQLPLNEVPVDAGAIAFWLQPMNWDNFTSYPSWEPIRDRWLLVARFIGRDRRDGTLKPYMHVQLPRAHEDQRDPTLIHPGRWDHYAVVWSEETGKWAKVYRNGRRFGRATREVELLPHVEPVHVELGVANGQRAAHNEPAVVAVDEVVGYSYPISDREVRQAHERWKGELEPIPLYDADVDYKFSISKLTLTVSPELAESIVPATVRTAMRDAAGKVVRGPTEAAIENGGARMVLNDGQPLPFGEYRFDIEILDDAGKVVLSDQHRWELEKEAWRGNQLGVLDDVPEPWTPIEVDGRTLRTRMTTYELTESGMPAQVIADGEAMLMRPIELLEAGEPLRIEKTMSITHRDDREVQWSSTLEGKTCRVTVRFTLDYDGLIRHELDIERTADRLAPLSWVMPIRDDRATHLMYHETGTTWNYVEVLDELTPREGALYRSRIPAFERGAERAKRKGEPFPSWSDYEAYAFLTQIDIHDMKRGLYWFADNARGWWQSQRIDAQRIERSDGEVRVICNLVAEPTDARPQQPIVFGLLPHPARPKPEFYRTVQRVSPEVDPFASDVFGAFYALPVDPRGGGNMKVYPADDPKHPQKGPSYDYAESLIPALESAIPNGLRTMYLSHNWYGCRAGKYDHWEWRSGNNGEATMTQSFVDYLCWEMNEWIGRGIWEAIYLDETYNEVARNVEAGQAVRLPDGTVQPGNRIWMFRQLMRRWRGLFHQHGKRPMLISHHTGSFLYPGVVYCDAYLDGEGHPIVTSRSGDFVAKLDLKRAETLQNGDLWGVTPFFMVCIWEGGLERGKDWNPHKRWSWRMARTAMSMLAHFENGVTYADQGGSVYRDYWHDVHRWTASPLDVPFRAYWRNERFIDVDGQGEDSAVSFYQKADRLLMVVSNFKKQPREIRIKLNRDALGLDSAAVRVEPWDTGYTPAPGEDVMSEAEIRESANQQRVMSLEDDDQTTDMLMDDFEDVLEGSDPASMAKRQRPRVEGDELIVPVRARDFRLINVTW